MKLASILVANESGPDRAIRVVVGLILLALVVVGPRSYWGLLGAVPLLTGMLGSCPLYSLVGISTCPTPAPSIRSAPR